MNKLKLFALLILIFNFFNIYSQNYSSTLFNIPINPININQLNLYNLGQGSYGDFYILYPGYYFSYPINSSNQYLNIYFNSTIPLSFYIMNQQNYQNFQNGSNFTSIYQNYTNYINQSIFLSSGNYYIVIYNNNTQNAYYYSTYSLINQPINNIYFPIGISDYGIYINNGNIYGYNITTNEVIGDIYLNSFSSYVDPSCSNNFIGEDSGSIQLNAVLELSNGQYYWLQNVLLINNTGGYYEFVDNIWNSTSLNSYLSNNSIEGNGIVSNYDNKYFYVYETNYSNLQYPLNVFLIINVTQNNSYPEIQFGYSFDGQNIYWYDNVTLLIPSSGNIVISPSITGSNNVEDLELVIGGPGYGTCIDINNISGYLGLYYLYNNQYITPDPSIFNFGYNTAEYSSNINENIISQGFVNLSEGPFYPEYFGSITPLNYNISVYYSYNNSYINYQYPFGTVFNINIPIYIYQNNTLYLLNNLTINGENYNINYSQQYVNISLLVNNNYNISANYTEYYLVTINDSIGINFMISGNYLNETYYNNTYYLYANNLLNIYLNQTYNFGNYQYYCPNNITLNINNPEIINLSNYCYLQYQLNISFPFNYTINNNTYFGNNSFYINANNNITILINLINYINNQERLYCNQNNITINITSPTSIDLSNYCIYQYLVNINTPFLVNISINNSINNYGNVSIFLNNGTIINILPSKYIYPGFFYNTIYYENGYNYIVNQPLNIVIQFNETIQYNYLNIGLLVGGIIGVVIFILY
ncbi:thermopsin family protease [Candidatus Nanobsidianus stetteri]|uniref:Thermopsin n=1 Tax=Nanobsidianus stetteri TaxID=1294122 RepID=A0A2T9WLE1_NANST|nr:thermopsin family protease [Candidatus Nanobsidianus stetteri]MCC5447180.1 thermopsin [Candidatus Nanobsidianus stetteri]